jgi:hypothetical protein
MAPGLREMKHARYAIASAALSKTSLSCTQYKTVQAAKIQLDIMFDIMGPLDCGISACGAGAGGAALNALWDVRPTVKARSPETAETVHFKALTQTQWYSPSPPQPTSTQYCPCPSEDAHLPNYAVKWLPVPRRCGDTPQTVTVNCM